MENSLLEFQKRHKAVSRKHARLSRGYVTRVDRKSGVITHEPESTSGAAGLKTLMILIPGFLLFKVFILAWLGADAYQQHVQELAFGSDFEKAGAWLMQMDPITAKLSAFFSALFG